MTKPLVIFTPTIDLDLSIWLAPRFSKFTHHVIDITLFYIFLCKVQKLILTKECGLIYNLGKEMNFFNVKM
jgi:hypothetical protein